MKAITPKELNQIVGECPHVVLVDVRLPSEYAQAHVPHARNIPLGELQPQYLPFPKQEPVYFLCASGNRSAVAARRFAREGYAASFYVAGGTLAWAEAGLPVAGEEHRVMDLDRLLYIVAGVLVWLGVLLGWLVNRGFLGLSALVGGWLIYAGLRRYGRATVFLRDSARKWSLDNTVRQNEIRKHSKINLTSSSIYGK